MTLTVQSKPDHLKSRGSGPAHIRKFSSKMEVQEQLVERKREEWRFLWGSCELIPNATVIK